MTKKYASVKIYKEQKEQMTNIKHIGGFPTYQVTLDDCIKAWYELQKKKNK